MRWLRQMSRSGGWAQARQGSIAGEGFGHRPGRLTGAASTGKHGRIQEARDGTLFLGEVRKPRTPGLSHGAVLTQQPCPNRALLFSPAPAQYIALTPLPRGRPRPGRRPAQETTPCSPGSANTSTP